MKTCWVCAWAGMALSLAGWAHGAETVRKIAEFGAFVEIFPGTDGLIHISELSDKRVKSVSDVLSEGEEVLVKVISVDRQGKIRLSRKEALADAAGKKVEAEAAKS